MAALPGLTGLYGPVEEPHGQTGRAPSNWGRPADQRHALPGDREGDPQYHATPYAPTIDNDAEIESTPLQGLPTDQTPDVHSAPYPRGVTHDPLIAAEQLRELHGQDLGGTVAPGRVGTPYPQHLSDTSGVFESPNASSLAKGTPAQLRSGSDDVDQGDGADNSYGFQFGHQFRRFFLDPVPLDRTATAGGERPFYGAHPVWQNRLDNDSEFGASGDISVGMNLRDTPVGTPTPWEQPPNVTYRPSADYPDQSGFAGDWMAG